MRDYLDHFLENPLYFIFILTAFFSGAVLYFFSQKEKRGSRLTLFLMTSFLSLVLSTAICMIVSAIFTTQKSAYRSFFSIFYYVTSFALISMIIEKCTEIGFTANDTVRPLLLTICLARIACMIEGCCGGVLPFSYIESLLALLTLLYSSIFKAPSLSEFLTGYSLYRFVTEFFKDIYFKEKLGALTLMQYAAISVVIACIIFIIIKKKKGDVKNEK